MKTDSTLTFDIPEVAALIKEKDDEIKLLKCENLKLIERLQGIYLNISDI